MPPTAPEPADEARDPEPDPFADLAPLPDSPRTPEMPDLLTRPVDHPRASHNLPPAPSGPSRSDSAAMARGWTIALNFAFAVIGMGVLGWAVQKWIWPDGAPWVLVVALMLGLVGGFVQFVRAALAANR